MTDTIATVLGELRLAITQLEQEQKQRMQAEAQGTRDGGMVDQIMRIINHRHGGEHDWIRDTAREIAALRPAPGVPEAIVRALPAPDVYHGNWNADEWWAIVQMLKWTRAQPAAPAVPKEIVRDLPIDPDNSNSWRPLEFVAVVRLIKWASRS
jgi:hypothetical protein